MPQAEALTPQEAGTEKSVEAEKPNEATTDQREVETKGDFRNCLNSPATGRTMKDSRCDACSILFIGVGFQTSPSTRYSRGFNICRYYFGGSLLQL